MWIEVDVMKGFKLSRYLGNGLSSDPAVCSVVVIYSFIDDVASVHFLRLFYSGQHINNVCLDSQYIFIPNLALVDFSNKGSGC